MNRRRPPIAVEDLVALRRKVDKPPIIPQKLLCRGFAEQHGSPNGAPGLDGGPARGPPASIRRRRRVRLCIPRRSPVTRGGSSSYVYRSLCLLRRSAASAAVVSMQVSERERCAPSTGTARCGRVSDALLACFWYRTCRRAVATAPGGATAAIFY